MKTFLHAILGEGASAIETAVSAAPQLEAVLVPRVLLSWVGLAASYGGTEGVPGCPGVDFVFRKNEAGGYDGRIGTGAQQYDFTGESLYHVAASLSVALDVAPSTPHPRSIELERLGKTIDLLVKSHLATTLMKHEPPGQTALPIKAGKPLAPEPPSRQKNAAPKPTPPKKLKVVPVKGKLPKLRLLLKHLETNCLECGRPQLREGKLVGCMCWSALLKNVQTAASNVALEFTFDDSWEPADIHEFAASVQGRE